MLIEFDDIEWADVVGFEGKYQISNHGHVKSLRRLIGNGCGYWSNERILKNQKDSDGYYIVGLPVGTRMPKTFAIHKLVARYFIGEYKDRPGYQICHLDGNKLNNYYKNLYIGDNITNTIDKYIQGRTKLKLEQIEEIRLSNLSQKELAGIYGVRQSYISRILSRKRGLIMKDNYQTAMQL